MYRRNSILDEMKASFKSGSYLTKLIYINLAMFVLIAMNGLVVKMGFSIGDFRSSPFYLRNWLELPSYLPYLVRQPWSIITYMFVHAGFLHILFNMLILYWFGTLFLMHIDQKKFLSVYLLGGIIGGALYILAYNIIPYFEGEIGLNVGASGAVMAIVIAIAAFKPDMEIHLFLFGRVKLKYLALIYLLIDLVSIANTTNEGGHITHLGGALYGYVFAVQYKKGHTVMKWFERLLDGLFTLFKPRNKIKVSYRKPPVDDFEYNAQKVEKQQEVDDILDKISKHGYDSLTKREKEILFKEGKN